MNFHYQRLGSGVKSDGLADVIIEQFGQLHFAGPGALMETLREWARTNDLSLQVSQFSGVINVHGEGGIILRIRPTE